MATSGVKTFNPNIIDILEEAYERAGLELRSGYDLKTGMRSFNFMMAEWANRGLNLWTIEEGSVVLTAGDNTADIADVVDVIDYVIRTGTGSTQSDFPLERISVSRWSSIVNKNLEGKPSQIYVERLPTTTRVHLWPKPSQQYTLVYWALTRMDDGVVGTNTADLPYRFIPALVAGLAYHIATKKPAAMARVPYLKEEYENQFQLAADEDRDRGSVFFLPWVG